MIETNWIMLLYKKGTIKAKYSGGMSLPWRGGEGLGNQ